MYLVVNAVERSGDSLRPRWLASDTGRPARSEEADVGADPQFLVKALVGRPVERGAQPSNHVREACAIHVARHTEPRPIGAIRNHPA